MNFCRCSGCAWPGAAVSGNQLTLWVKEPRGASPALGSSHRALRLTGAQRCCVKSSHMAPKLERMIRDLQLDVFQWVPLCPGASPSLACQLMTTTPISKFWPEDREAQTLSLWPLTEQNSVYFCCAWVWTGRREMANAVIRQGRLSGFLNYVKLLSKTAPFV